MNFDRLSKTFHCITDWFPRKNIVTAHIYVIVSKSIHKKRVLRTIFKYLHFLEINYRYNINFSGDVRLI